MFNIFVDYPSIQEEIDIVKQTTSDHVPELKSKIKTLEALFGDKFMRSELNPRTVAFLGYSETRVATDGASALQDDRSVFVKFGYSWNL